MEKKKVTLAEIGIDVTEVNEQLVALQKEINTISESQKAMRKNGQTATKAYQDQAIQLKDLKKQYGDTQKVAMGLNAIQSKEITTVAEARKAVAALNVKWANTTKLYGENSKESTLMQEQLNKTRSRLKELEEQAGNTAPAVGGYKDAIQQSIGAMGGLNPVLAKTTMGFKQLGLVLKANPIIFIVTAIVTALGALVRAFKSTDDGGTVFLTIMEQIKVTIDVLRNRLIDLGQAIRDVFKGEKSIREAGAAIKESFKGIGDEIREVVKAADTWANALDNLENAENNWISRQAELRNAQARARYTAEDKEKDISIRREATQEYLNLLMQEVEQEKQFAKQRLDIETDKLAAMAGVDAKQILRYVRMSDAERENADASLNEMRNRYEGQVNELEKLYAAYIDADTAYFEQGKRGLARLGALAKEEQDIFEKRKETNAEFVEMVLETINTELMWVQSKEAATMNELRIDENFTAEQKRMIEERKQASIEEREQYVLDQKLKAQAASEMLGALSSILGQQTAAGKAAAIAQATINTYLGATQALTDPTIPSTVGRIAMAVAVIANGLASVAQIAKADKSGGGGVSSSAGRRDTIATTQSSMASTNLYSGIVSIGATNTATQQEAQQANMANAFSKQQTVLVIEDFQNVADNANKVAVQGAM